MFYVTQCVVELEQHLSTAVTKIQKILLRLNVYEIHKQ